MQVTPHPSLWQTFFNLGGIAGALSLIWQVSNTLRERARRARLEIVDFIANRDIFNVRWNSSLGSDDVRFVTLQVRNKGRRYARGCVARAVAVPSSGIGEEKEVPLHWADTAVTYQTTGQPPVDIAPGGSWRLDVAFSRSSGQAAWLASTSALNGNHFNDSQLTTGQHSITIRVSFDDGDDASYRLRLTSSVLWSELNAAVHS